MSSTARLLNPKTHFWPFRAGSPEFEFVQECGNCPQCGSPWPDKGVDRIVIPLARWAFCPIDKNTYIPRLSIGIDLSNSMLFTEGKMYRRFVHVYKDLFSLYNKSFLSSQLYAWGSASIKTEFRTVNFTGKDLHEERPDLYYNLFYYAKSLSISNDEELSSFVQGRFPDFTGVRVICTGFY